MQSNATEETLDLDFHMKIKMTPVLSKTVLCVWVQVTIREQLYVISILHNKQVPLYLRSVWISSVYLGASDFTLLIWAGRENTIFSLK